MRIKQGQTIWLYYYLTKTDGSEITGLTYDNVTCKYKSAGVPTWNTRILTSADFVEIGNGIYGVRWTSNEIGAETDSDKSFITYLLPNVTDAVPAVREDEVVFITEVDLRDQIDATRNNINSNITSAKDEVNSNINIKANNLEWIIRSNAGDD